MQELGQILSKTAGITDQKVIEHVFKLADTQQKGLLSYDQFLEIIRHWKQKVFSILFGVILWSVKDLSIVFCEICLFRECLMADCKRAFLKPVVYLFFFIACDSFFSGYF